MMEVKNEIVFPFLSDLLSLHLWHSQDRSLTHVERMPGEADQRSRNNRETLSALDGNDGRNLKSVK